MYFLNERPFSGNAGSGNREAGSYETVKGGG